MTRWVKGCYASMRTRVWIPNICIIEHISICSYNYSSREAKTDPRGLLASQPYQTGALQGHEGDCLTKTKKQIHIAIEGDTQC